MFISLDDEYVWEPHYKRLNRPFLSVPGLHMFGKADFKKATVSLEEHIHPNCCEFVVLLSGVQEYSVASETYSLRGGDVFMTAPDEIHKSAQPFQQVARFLWFQLDISNPDGFLGLSPLLGSEFYHGVLNYKKRLNKVSAQDLELLARSFSCFASGSEGGRRLGYSLFLSFLSVLLNASEERARISPDIQKVLDFIHADLSCSAGCAELAQVANISVSRLKAKFKEQLGITPHEYVSRLKIEHAKTLLLRENCTITETAFELNFSSSNYFASVFKQFTGFTPSEYIRLASSGKDGARRDRA